MAHRTLSEDSRTVERLRRRGERLLIQRQLYSGARDACRRCYAVARMRPVNVNIRESFIVSRSTAPESQAVVDSPAASLITPRGIALQVYLMAIFEAQCRVRAGMSVRNDRPIASSNRETLGWLDLIASETVTAKLPTTKRDNLLRQFKRGLLHLERERLVVLSGNPNSNGRFEFFRLLNESGRLSSTGSEIPYVVPKEPPSGTELMEILTAGGRSPLEPITDIPVDPVIDIPVDFFLYGWAHVLSPAEIATYLMLRHLTYTHKADQGVFVCAKPREQFYGLRRDVYESHRLLCLYGIVERVHNKNRRNDGTVRSFNTEGNPLEPHRFIFPPDALKRDAFEVVVRNLRDPMPIFADTSDEVEFIKALMSAVGKYKSNTGDSVGRS